MSTPAPDSTFRRLMLAADLEPGSEAVWAHALRLCLDTRGVLTVVHARGPYGDRTWTDVPTARELLQLWGAVGQATPLEDFERLGMQIHLREIEAIDPRARLPWLMELGQPDLLVTGTHRPQGIERALHGSVGEALARQAPHAALVVPDGVRPIVDLETGLVNLRRVLVPIGVDEHQQLAIDAAARCARSLGTPRVEFLLLHAGPRSEVPPLDLPTEPAWGWRWIDHEAGATVRRILETATQEHVDLVCMVTHGHDSLVDLVVGSRTEQVIRSAPCPVLVVSVPAR
jgi:nucleotide-binding universal stress UspA family protein